MVQVLALAEIMEVTVSIEYLDGRPFDDDRGLILHEFALPAPVQTSDQLNQESKESLRKWSKVILLYRYVKVGHTI
jgi:hypothetical protein